MKNALHTDKDPVSLHLISLANLSLTVLPNAVLHVCLCQRMHDIQATI